MAKIGSVIYATHRGLGMLGRIFYDHGVITHPIVLHHGRYQTHTEWYPGCLEITKRPFLNEEVKECIRNMDAMLFFETPFDWDIIKFCKEVGTRCSIVSMYECTPNNVPHEPDLWINPSLLDQQYFPQGVFIPIPVSTGEWQLKERARKFVHNGGDLGINHRNGTLYVLEAMKYVKSPIDITIRSQNVDEFNVLIDIHKHVKTDPRVTLVKGNIPHEDLWSPFDVCVAPERKNGMSFPLIEAFSGGLLCITTQRFPMNTWLPCEPMIPVASVCTNKIGGCKKFEECTIDPRTLAHVIDEWYDKDITTYSMAGKMFREENSWENLKPRYLEAILGK